MGLRTGRTAQRPETVCFVSSRHGSASLRSGAHAPELQSCASKPQHNTCRSVPNTAHVEPHSVARRLERFWVGAPEAPASAPSGKGLIPLGVSARHPVTLAIITQRTPRTLPSGPRPWVNRGRRCIGKGYHHRRRLNTLAQGRRRSPSSTRPHSAGVTTRKPWESRGQRPADSNHRKPSANDGLVLSLKL